MKRLLKVFFSWILISGVFLAGCAVAPVSPTPGAVPTAAATPDWTIYAPESTSSIPVILAAQKLAGAKLVLYTNQSQANALFLRGEAPVLVTGLSVGLDLFKNGGPVKLVNSYVTGLSYLVTYGKAVSSFADLKGQEIYVPFEGSPIEEACAYLAQKEGLEWKKDILPVYSPFDASVALLKQGKARAVVLPEPTVSTLEGQPDLYISLSLFDAWNRANSSSQGYPQVATFVNSTWASAHPEQIEAFNQALGAAILSVQQDPTAAVQAAKSYFKLPADTLAKSLSRTRYQLTTGAELKRTITTYYQAVGKPFDEKFAGIYYLASK